MKARLVNWRSIVTAGAMCVVFAAAPAAAQTTERSGLEGKVVDQSGAVLPGVTVTISSPSLQRPQLVTTTDAEGRYRFTALPAGTYTAAFDLTGFQGVQREGLRLNVGFIATVDVKMNLGGVTESLTVSGLSPVVDIRSTGVSTNFTVEALETVPTSRTMWQILAISPGIRMTGTGAPDVGGSQTGTQQGYANYGSNAGGDRPQIEGVDTRGPGGCAGGYFDFGAFDEVQVKAMGNDAEMPLSGTNFVGVIKSGSNQFHGRGLYQYESPSLQSDNLDDALRARNISSGNPLLGYYDSNADLGGRIIRDRLWFYGAGHWQQIRAAVIGYPGENKNSLTNYSTKVNAQVNPKQRLTGFFQYNKKDQPERGGNALTPPQSTIHQVFKPTVVKGEWAYTATDHSLIDVLVGRHQWDSIWNPAYPGSGPSTFDAVTLQNGGTSLINNTSSSARERRQVSGTFSYYKSNFLGGEHQLKAGLEFDTEAYSRTIRDRGSDGNYQLIFQSGSPFQIITYNNPFKSLNSEHEQSAFVTDSWRLGDRLTLNIGLRFDRYFVFLPPQSKPPGTFSTAADFPKIDVQDWSAVVPRVAVSYALTADRKTVVKATYGRFAFPGLPETANTYNKNGLVTTTYRWNDLNLDKRYQDGELGTFVNSAGGTSTILNPALGQPKTDEATATFEREVANNFSARVTYVYKRDTNLFQLVNLARPFSAYSVAISGVDPGPDGRVGTGDDGGPITYHDYSAAFAGAAFQNFQNINTPGFSNQFHNIEMVANKRLSNRWQMLTSFLATKRDVWLATGAPYLGVPQDPNAANFYPKDQTWEWNYKVSGSYLLPYDIQLATFFSSQSGVPYARTARFTSGLTQSGSVVLNMEPVGSQRRPTQNLLSLRAEKRQKLGFGTATVQFDVFNALNTNVLTNLTIQSGATYGNILAIVPPRIARVGVTFSF